MIPAEWYDFVPLPNQKESAPDAASLTHAKHVPGRYSGSLDLILTTLSPVHIGSGAYELSEDAGLEGGTAVKGIVRVNGRPVIPSSSLKGALRSVYETITFSCIGKYRGFAQERYHRNIKKSELPQSLIDDMPNKLQRLAEDNSRKPPKISVKLDKEELKELEQCRLGKGQSDLRILCPTCGLFGVENFQGRISFSDAEIFDLSRGSKESIQIPSLYSPRLHLLGDPMFIPGSRSPFVQVINIKGRKLYYKIRLGDVPAEGRVLIDYLPIGTKLCTQLHFINVTVAELGGLLVALGQDPENPFSLRIGAGKPVGLGYIAFEIKGAYVQNSATTFLEFNTKFNEVEAIKTYIQAFKECDGNLFYLQGLEKLLEITARPYVPAKEVLM